MLTTQADRFSPEEVHYGLFNLIVIIIADCIVWEERHRDPQWIITPFSRTPIMLCLWGMSCDKGADDICFLLHRWSRCSLPSRRMWRETWTTRTWYTSLPTERKRTRSEPLRRGVHHTESLPFARTWLETDPRPVKEIWTVYLLIVPVEYSLESTRGSRLNFLSRSPEMDNWWHWHTEPPFSLSALSTVCSHIHLRQVKLFFLIILQTQNHMLMSLFFLIVKKENCPICACSSNKSFQRQLPVWILILSFEMFYVKGPPKTHDECSYVKRLIGFSTWTPATL